MYYTAPDKCMIYTTLTNLGHSGFLLQITHLNICHMGSLRVYLICYHIVSPYPDLFWVVLHQLLKQWDHHNDLSHLGQDFEQIRSKCHGHLFAYIHQYSTPFQESTLCKGPSWPIPPKPKHSKWSNIISLQYGMPLEKYFSAYKYIYIYVYIYIYMCIYIYIFKLYIHLLCIASIVQMYVCLYN